MDHSQVSNLIKLKTFKFLRMLPLKIITFLRDQINQQKKMEEFKSRSLSNKEPAIKGVLTPTNRQKLFQVWLEKEQ